ncbi:recombinase [Anaerobacillus alkalilacustris]|uniref:Recombinase n=1 Tax=Anaerobacillus alkalilacustris TaxID=393763 RepID=A0A1S2LQM2_9BACI|nr:recombinase family protein [Anaerobacillus alkalilacustris]OIJ13695.1 recombinase [Anaerobacillus alkalilacustris]
MVTVNAGKKLVAIYVRKSRLKDADALEISRQLELLTDYADKNNMEYEIFSEEGSSEDWDGRPELQRMMMELRRNIYDGVLVTDQDRLTRDRTDFGLFVRFMKNEGLMLFTLNKTYNFMNDDDIFTSGIQSEMDNHFMRMTKRKLRRGRIQAIKKGVYFGIAPFGYTKDDQKHLSPHPEESKVVQDIFNMYVYEGMNMTEIQEQLELRGIKNRKGKLINVRALSIILDNVAYRGTVHYELTGEDVITVEEAHPALVDSDTFKKAQVLRAERRKVPQSQQKGLYTLSKLVVCPKCKQTLSFCMKYGNREGRAKLDMSSRHLYLLNCYASKGARAKAEMKGIERCSNNGIKISRLQEAILNKLREHLTEIDAEIEAVLSGSNDIISKVAQKQQELTLQYNQLDKQKKNVQDGFKMGIYEAEEAQAEIRTIKEAQLSIEQELKNLEGADAKSEVEKQKKLKAKIELLLSMEHTVNESNETSMRANKLLHDVIDKVWYWKPKNDVGGDKPFEITIDYK